jgi:hypothetical protein
MVQLCSRITETKDGLTPGMEDEREALTTGVVMTDYETMPPFPRERVPYY